MPAPICPTISSPVSRRPVNAEREFHNRIVFVKKWFGESLCDLLNLEMVMSPLFLAASTGLNDHLNGTERPVSFSTKEYGEDMPLEVIQSLAKWKRDYLGRQEYLAGEGIVADMRAIRRDEDLSPIHSLLVTQWDWEKVIRESDRSVEYLHKTVRQIYAAIKEVEAKVNGRFGTCPPPLPSEIVFVTSVELEARFPDNTPKERENLITEEHRAVFIEGIGGKLPVSGEYHDGRACDYDDWTLNGDILIWHPALACAFEISSMGIRVDADALRAQAKERGEMEKLQLPFHRKVLNDELPFTIGGGIGQCRLCMYFLQAHQISQVQPGYCPK